MITFNTCAVEFLDSYLDVFVLPWSKKASVCFHRPHLNLAIPLKGTVGNLTCLKMHLITSVQCTYIVHHIISCRTFPYQTVSMFFYFTSNCVMVMKVFTCMEKPIWVKENVERLEKKLFLPYQRKQAVQLTTQILCVVCLCRHFPCGVISFSKHFCYFPLKLTCCAVCRQIKMCLVLLVKGG